MNPLIEIFKFEVEKMWQWTLLRNQKELPVSLVSKQIKNCDSESLELEKKLPILRDKKLELRFFTIFKL